MSNCKSNVGACTHIALLVLPEKTLKSALCRVAASRVMYFRYSGLDPAKLLSDAATLTRSPHCRDVFHPLSCLGAPALVAGTYPLRSNRWGLPDSKHQLDQRGTRVE